MEIQSLFVLALFGRRPFRFFSVICIIVALTFIDYAASMTMTSVENFRPVAGTNRLYRCANTDVLAESQTKCTILSQAGLIVDLRSQEERNEDQAKLWMQRHGFESVEERQDVGSTSARTVLRIDVQPRERILDYLTKNWLTPAQKGLNVVWTVMDAQRQHEMRMDALNERGLAGLYEAILESGGDDLCFALKQITRHLEAAPVDSIVVIHCVQGKDRTGILAMLCQSILAMSDEDIIEEYAKSECMRDKSFPPTNEVTVKGKFDRKRFAGSPPQAMRDTLAFLRSKYGSVCPGYLDHICFDKSWRDRFVASQANPLPDIAFVSKL